jgi:hypothetical protein
MSRVLLGCSSGENMHALASKNRPQCDDPDIPGCNQSYPSLNTFVRQLATMRWRDRIRDVAWARQTIPVVLVTTLLLLLPTAGCQDSSVDQPTPMNTAVPGRQTAPVDPHQPIPGVPPVAPPPQPSPTDPNQPIPGVTPLPPPPLPEPETAPVDPNQPIPGVPAQPAPPPDWVPGPDFAPVDPNQPIPGVEPPPGPPGLQLPPDPNQPIPGIDSNPAI